MSFVLFLRFSYFFFFGSKLINVLTDTNISHSVFSSQLSNLYLTFLC